MPLERSLILPFLTVSLCNGSVNGNVFYARSELDFWQEVKQKPLIVMDNVLS
jgi:hypothetical protein